jgi:glycosyltransferase involved in cell wall biosynthesis
VDDVVLVDDKSPDNTVEVARALGIKHIVIHEQNKGYGGNQKSCYDKARSLGADIVVMLHPDYQYTPKLLVSQYDHPDRQWCLPGGLRLADPRWGRVEGRHAAVQVRGQPHAHLTQNLLDGREAERIPHRLPRLPPQVLDALRLPPVLG